MTFLSWALLALGCLLRAILAFFVEPFLNWDEAPQAYMAQLVSKGELFPLVYFQIPYIGALEIYPLAFFMKVFGDNVATINLFFFLLSIASLYGGRIVYSHLYSARWANLALAIYALGHPFVLLITLQGYGFGTLVMLEALILWVLVRFREKPRARTEWLLLGIINGLSLFNNVLSTGVLILSFWYVLHARKDKAVTPFLAGFLLGYAPMLAFNFANDLISYQILVAKFLGINRAMVEDSGIGGALLSGLANKLTGHGPESDLYILFALPRFFRANGYYIQVLGIGLLALTCLVSLVGIVVEHVRAKTPLRTIFRDEKSALYVSILILMVPGISQVRYMAVLLPLVPILATDGLKLIWEKNCYMAYIIGGGLFSYMAIAHFAVLIDDVDNNTWKDGWNDGVPQAPVYRFLQERNMHYGYGSYQFQSYAAFLSRGQIKISPQIGPLYLDKIPSFSRAVDQSDSVFYILPNRSDYFDKLEKRGTTYRIERIGNWNVLWDMDERLYPEDILPESEMARSDGIYRWSYRFNSAVANPYRGGH